MPAPSGPSLPPGTPPSGPSGIAPGPAARLASAQAEAIASLAADGDRLAALAEAVVPMIAELGEFIDGVVSSLRAAGLLVEDPAMLPIGEIESLLAQAELGGVVVARTEDFDPPLTPAQAERAQQAINDALTRDRALRPEAVLRTDADGHLINFQGRRVLVDSEGLPILVAGLPVVAPGS